MTPDAQQGGGSARSDAKPRARVTTVRKAVIIGTLVALLTGGLSSLVTAQLIGQPAAGGNADIDRLNAEIAALEDLASTALERVRALEGERPSSNEQPSVVPNPTPGPSPTALLTVNWVRNLNVDSEEIVVCVTIENTSDGATSIFYHDSQFTAFDGGNFVYPPVVNPYFLSVPLQGGELRPGESRRGELPYVISPQAQPLVRLVWDTGFEGMREIAVDLTAAGVYDNNDLC